MPRGLFQQGLEVFHLLVDCHAQGQERPGGGIDFIGGSAPMRDRLSNQVGKATP